MGSAMASVLAFFFFNDTATTEIYTLSLHDALPIYVALHTDHCQADKLDTFVIPLVDRKSTRLNSSHTIISYAVFCLKKKNQSPRPESGRTGPGCGCHHRSAARVH